MAHEHDNVIVGSACLCDGYRQVGLAVAEVARHDRLGRTDDVQPDCRRRLERPGPVAQQDRDAVGRGQGDGHVEVVVAVEVADCDRRRVLVLGGVNQGAGRGGSLKRPIPGSQVDTVRGHNVRNVVVVEVANGQGVKFPS